MKNRFKKLATICLGISMLTMSSTQISATTPTSDVAQLTPVITIPVGAIKRCHRKLNTSNSRC